MNKIVISVIIVFFAFSCKEIEEENGPSIKVVFEFKNNSSKNVEIKLYKPDNFLLISKSVTPSDSALLDEGFLHPAPNGPTYRLTNNLDSAELIFSDGKRLVQTMGSRGITDTINNILSDRFYKSIPELGRTRMQFTLTEQDYLRAK
jgi:hypothetical protein